MGYKKVNEDSLSMVANAIRAKTGGNAQLAFPNTAAAQQQGQIGFVEAIESIPQTSSLPDIQTTDEAIDTDIRYGKKAYNDQGILITGHMQEWTTSGLQKITPATPDHRIGFNAGYFNYAHSVGVEEADANIVTLTQNNLNQVLRCNSSNNAVSGLSVGNKFMNSVKVLALGGDIYRMETGTSSFSSETLNFNVNGLGFTPEYVFILLVTPPSSGRAITSLAYKSGTVDGTVGAVSTGVYNPCGNITVSAGGFSATYYKGASYNYGFHGTYWWIACGR